MHCVLYSASHRSPARQNEMDTGWLLPSLKGSLDEMLMERQERTATLLFSAIPLPMLLLNAEPGRKRLSHQLPTAVGCVPEQL